MGLQDQSGDAVYLSVVAPAHNEMDNLPRLLEEIAAALVPFEHRWEMIVTDDASTDGTAGVLRDLRRKYPQLRVLTLRQRSGQTAALDAGLRRAKGTFVATLDADLQNDPADIPHMLDLLQSQPCDFVNGWRADRRDPWLRRISTRVANRVRNWLMHEQIHDSGCGLKVFRRECLNRVKLFNGMHRFLPTLVRMEGYRVLEVPVSHRPRTAGQAKYGLFNLVFKALRDAFAVRWMQQRTVHYECREEEP
jgi:dolichol-phosphate mannosyltransferase